MPTETEWEYACRAATDSLFYFDDDVNQLLDYAWFRTNAIEAKVCSVGQKKPNAWGLHDMLGNVWEWCEDAYKPYGVSTAKNTDAYRVIRGGSVNSTAVFLRCAYRLGSRSDESTPRLGFRVVREP